MFFNQWTFNGKEYNFCTELPCGDTSMGETYYGWKFSKGGLRFSDDFVHPKYWVKNGGYKPVDFDVSTDHRHKMIIDILTIDVHKI